MWLKCQKTKVIRYTGVPSPSELQCKCKLNAQLKCEGMCRWLRPKILIHNKYVSCTFCFHYCGYDRVWVHIKLDCYGDRHSTQCLRVQMLHQLEIISDNLFSLFWVSSRPSHPSIDMTSHVPSSRNAIVSAVCRFVSRVIPFWHQCPSTLYIKFGKGIY